MQTPFRGLSGAFQAPPATFRTSSRILQGPQASQKPPLPVNVGGAAAGVSGFSGCSRRILGASQGPPPRRLLQGCGLKLGPPNPKPNLLLVTTNSRLDSLQAKSLEPGPTKHCTAWSTRVEETRGASSSSGGNWGPRANPKSKPCARLVWQVSQAYQGFQTNARSLQGPARGQGPPRASQLKPRHQSPKLSGSEFASIQDQAFRGNWAPRAKPKAKPSARRNWFKA